MARFDWVFFDSGGTLFDETGGDPPRELIRARRAQRMRAALTGLGAEADAPRLDAILGRLESELPGRLGAAYTFLRLMEECIREMRLPLGKEDAACLADAYAGPRYASWLLPGTREALEELAAAGVHLGLIANTAWCGFSMDRAFAGVGLLGLLHPRLYSSQVGLAKPDAQIFHLAEDHAAAAGQRICYVGNDVDADVRGAAGVGWSSAFRRHGGLGSGGLADLDFDDWPALLAWVLNA
jgi:putative hydrolase of the HAD superfamily